MCFQLEKMMKENADKLSAGDKGPLETAIDKVRETAKGEEPDAIKSAIAELEQVAHAFSKTLYESKGRSRLAAQLPERAAGSQPKGSSDDEAIDAEFEVKDS